MVYQWYPGHMSKAKRQIEADLRLVDVVIELLDARIPQSSRNPEISRLTEQKPRVVLLNKSDLADPAETKKFQSYFEKQGAIVLSVNAKNGTGVKKIVGAVELVCKGKRERDQKKGIVNRPLRAMILGIPNVGKSTVINALAGKNCAITGNKPGVTKGKQWIRLNKDIELLDTPGILWPKFEDQRVGLRIALIGSINEDILDPVELATKLFNFLLKRYPGLIQKKYHVDENEDGYEMLKKVALKRGAIKKGGEPDLLRASGFVMDEFRSGKIGCVTLDRLYDKEEEKDAGTDDNCTDKEASF